MVRGWPWLRRPPDDSAITASREDEQRCRRRSPPHSTLGTGPVQAPSAVVAWPRTYTRCGSAGNAGISTSVSWTGTRPWRVFLSRTSDLRDIPRDQSFVSAAEHAVL